MFPALDPEWLSTAQTSTPNHQQKPQKEPREPRDKKKPKHQYQQESQGDWGGRGGSEAHGRDGFCGYSEKYTDGATGKVNHMQCPFYAKFYHCRSTHKELEKHTGDAGVKATEEEYQAVKKKCKEAFPDWTENDIFMFPSAKHNTRTKKGEGKGKGNGKGGKGKGKGW